MSLIAVLLGFSGAVFLIIRAIKFGAIAEKPIKTIASDGACAHLKWVDERGEPLRTWDYNGVNYPIDGTKEPVPILHHEKIQRLADGMCVNCGHVALYATERARKEAAERERQQRNRLQAAARITAARDGLPMPPLAHQGALSLAKVDNGAVSVADEECGSVALVGDDA